VTTWQFSAPITLCSRKRYSGQSESPRKKCGNQEHGEDIRDFETKDSGDDEWLEQNVVPEDEEGQGEDFNRLNLTEDERGQVKLTVNPEFRETSRPSLKMSGKETAGGSSQAKSWSSTVTPKSYSTETVLSGLFSASTSSESLEGPSSPVVTGSQAGDGQHKVYVMKWADLTLMQGWDDREDSDDNEELEPKLEHVSFSDRGAVNRVRLWITQTKSLLGVSQAQSISSTLQDNCSSWRGREGNKG
jgi:hypothetical protein